MAIALQHVAANGTSASGTSLVLTVPAGGMAAGNKILLLIVGSSLTTTMTAADSKGNTYTHVAGSPWNATANARGHWLYCDIGVALAAGDTITITASGNTNMGACAMEYSGLAAGGADGVSSPLVNASVSSVDPNAVTTTVANDLVVVGYFGQGSQNIIGAATNYTRQATGVSSGTIRTVDTEDRILSAAAGSEDPGSTTLSGTTGNCVTLTTAWAPAASGPVTTPKTLSASVTSTAGLQKLVIPTAKSASSAKTALLNALTVHPLTLAAVSVASATLRRTVQATRAASSAATASRASLVSRTLAASSGATAALRRVVLLTRGAASSALATVARALVPAAPAGPEGDIRLVAVHNGAIDLAAQENGALYLRAAGNGSLDLLAQAKGDLRLTAAPNGEMPLS